MDVSNTPWSSSSQADYYDEQCQRATILDHQAGTTPKERYGFPVREPDGTLNGRGVHAATGRSSEVRPEAASVSRARSSPGTTVLTDRYQRKRVNSPNDGVCRGMARLFSLTRRSVCPPKTPSGNCPAVECSPHTTESLC